MAETSVAEIVNAPHNKPPARPGRRESKDAVVVTGETFNAYVAERLGKDAPAAEPGPEEKAKAELAKVEKEKAERLAKDKPKAEEADEEIDHPDEDKKGKLNARFSELTKARKEAEAKAAKEAEQRTAAEKRAAEIERERDALKAKYEPPKGDDAGPEPQPEQFADPKEFAKALKDWTAESVRIEDAKKSKAERAAKEQAEMMATWRDAEAAIRQEVGDYDKRLSDSPVLISDQMRDAILDAGTVGPRILLWLADNPEDAARIGKLPVGKMLKEIGGLEREFKKGAKEPAKDKPAAAQHTAAEISRAPAPISPLSGGGEPVTRLSGHQEVPKSMDYETWKALRKAGKIR